MGFPELPTAAHGRRPTGRRPTLPAIPMLLVFAGLAGLTTTACGPRPGLVRLPTGQGTPAPDGLDLYDAATRLCRGVDQVSAEIALSGRVAGERVRGRLLVGLARPDGVRVEAVAPFGAPVFVLTANGGEGALLLPRDNRLVSGVPPEDLLEALAGLALAPSDLLALVSGCLSVRSEATEPLAYGDAWRKVSVPGGDAWLRLDDGRPRLVAGDRGGYAVEYAGFVSGVPRRVRIHTRRSHPVPVDLVLEIRQLDLAPGLDRRVFDAVVPPGVVPMTLDELRRGGLLGR